MLTPLCRLSYAPLPPAHLHHTQVSQQREGEWETHPSVYCTAQIWGEGEGRLWPLPLTDGPHALCVCP